MPGLVIFEALLRMKEATGEKTQKITPNQLSNTGSKANFGARDVPTIYIQQPATDLTNQHEKEMVGSETRGRDKK